MRMAMQYTTIGQHLLEVDGEVIGVSFGADATTEHECGIEPIMEAFGRRDRLPRTLMQRCKRKPGDRIYGIDARRIHRCPELVFEDDGHDVILVYGHRGTYLDGLRGGPLRFSGLIEDKKNMVCAWSNCVFGIRARGDMRPHVLLLKKLLEEKRAAVMLTAQWLCHGFTILDADKFPTDINEKWVEQERAAEERLAQWKSSGIEQMLRKAGKQWFSLGHRVIQDNDGVLRTWLNPYEQGREIAGWYTFDELRAWARNEGPVLKENR